ncbi:30S ribosomal protein S3 [Planctomycetota bacterium]
MGQKVCPIGLRLGITEDWRSRWYANKKDFGKFVVQDQRIRTYIKKNFKNVGIPRVEIERTKDSITVVLHAARPGVIIGKRGSKVEELEVELGKIAQSPVQMKIIEVQKPELDSQLVAEGISEQLMKRSSLRRALKKSVEVVSDAGALGVKIIVSGRINGAEIARREKIIHGAVPLHTLRAIIDYGFAEANTTYGVIGIKVWIYKGEIFSEKEVKHHGIDAKTSEIPQKPAGKNKR